MARICIVSPLGWGAINGGVSGHAGGVERQTSMLARWLAGRGHEVTFLTWGLGQPEDVMIDDVRVLTLCAQNAGLPGIRFLHPRWTSLNAAMTRANAQVYYQNCGDYVTGQVAWWCERNRRGFVYSVASDPDCDPRLPKLPKTRERLLYRYGLRHADRVIVQTPRQQEMLKSAFNLESTVVPMPCAAPPSPDILAKGIELNGRPRFAWVGRICSVKRLEVLLDIAERMPEADFDVVGGPDPGEREYVQHVVPRAQFQRNVRLRGLISRAGMADVYRSSAALVCTSAYEGFPNTFLEAWSYGVPVVSTVDPGVIDRLGLGMTARDVDGIVAELRGLVSSPDRWNRISQAARTYYQQHHTVESAMPQFERVLLEVAGAHAQEPVSA